MASKRRLRRKSCGGKVPHFTRDAALRHRRELIKASGGREAGRLDVYWCRFGAHLHVGHSRAAGA